MSQRKRMQEDSLELSRRIGTGNFKHCKLKHVIKDQNQKPFSPIQSVQPRGTNQWDTRELIDKIINVRDYRRQNKSMQSRNNKPIKTEQTAYTSIEMSTFAANTSKIVSNNEG